MHARASTVRGHLRNALEDVVLAYFKINITTNTKGKGTAKSEDTAAAAASKIAKRIAWLKKGEIPRYMYRVSVTLKSWCLSHGPGTQHYAGKEPSHLAEASFLARGLQQYLWRPRSKRNSVGKRYIDKFDPVPLPTLALLFTAVRLLPILIRVSCDLTLSHRQSSSSTPGRLECSTRGCPSKQKHTSHVTKHI